MLVKDAKAIVKIGNANTKMPGTTFSQSALECNVGSKLVKIKGSICEGCYAIRLMNLRPSVRLGWTRNYEKSVNMIANNPDKWVAACVFQIMRQANKTGELYHRWYDAGDLDSIGQLVAIVKVANETPDIKHWLPTRELAIVKAYRDQFGDFPSNLTVRLSAPMVDQRPLTTDLPTSTVHRKGSPVVGHACPAPDQDNNCGSCRACWTYSGNVSYTKH